MLITWFIVPAILFALGAIFLGGLAAVCFRRTRVLGTLLLGAGTLGAIVIFFGLFFARTNHMASNSSAQVADVNHVPFAGDPISERKADPFAGYPVLEKEAEESRADSIKNSQAMGAHVDAPTEPAASGEPPRRGGMIRALGNAVSESLSSPKKTERPAPPKTPDVPPAPSGSPDEARTNALVKSFVAAVVEEMPQGMDELGALKLLGHYLGRAIAAEQERGVEAAIPPLGSDDRPDWVGAPDGRRGNGYQMVVTVGPYSSRRRCEEDLPKTLQSAVADYARLLLGSPLSVQELLPFDYLREQVVQEEWEEPGEIVAGHRMVNLHVRLLFDAKTNERIKQAWRDAEAAGRVKLAGAALGGVLLLLSAVFGVLKVDQATGGRFRKRAVVAAVVGLPVLGLLAVFVLARLPSPVQRPPLRPDLVSIDDTPTVPPGAAQAESKARMEYSGSVETNKFSGSASASAAVARPVERVPTWSRLAVLGLLVGVGLIVFRRTRVAGAVLLAVGAAVVLGLMAVVS